MARRRISVLLRIISEPKPKPKRGSGKECALASRAAGQDVDEDEEVEQAEETEEVMEVEEEDDADEFDVSYLLSSVR